MSIASEFDSTIENIKSDYEGLENLGADLTNVNKNIQNIRTCLDNIYDNLPKTTGEGSNLSLSTLKGRINVDDIKGDTEQDTYEGYNLLNVYNNIQNDSVTIAGLNYKINKEGIVTISGTATSYSGMYSKNGFNSTTPILTLKANHTYRILLEVAKNTGQVRFYMGPSGQNPYYIANITTNGIFTQDYTINEDVVITQFSFIGGIKGNVQNNCTMKVAIIDITNQQYNTWEPFVNNSPSPNPSYPQEINVATGTQEVVVETKNLLEGIELGDISSQTGAESTSTSAVRGTNYIRYFTNTDYFPSVNGNLIASGNVINLRFYNKDKQYIGYSTLLRTGGRNFSITITTSVVDTTPYYFRIRTTTSVATTTDNIMISYSSDTTYVEHQEQTKTLHLGDIELAKIGTYQDRIYKNDNKWYIEKNIGKKDDIKATDFSLYNQNVGNNVYQFRTGNYYFTGVQLTPDPFNIEDIAYSNYFLKKAGINSLNNYYFTITGTGAMAINTPFANTTRLAEWMNGKTIEVYYQLATPTYEEITNTTLKEELNELEKMMSYNGKTNISISGNLPMILNVSALKGE